MRRILTGLAALVGLAASPAHAYDPAKAGRYGAGDFDKITVGGSATVDALQVTGNGSSGPIDG